MIGHLFAVRSFLLNLVKNDDGQDLVEYALAVALIAFGSVSAMHYLAANINSSLMWISDVVASAPAGAPAAGY